jgi:hypothetical protein
MRRTGFALAAAALSLAAASGVVQAQPAPPRPPGQTGQNTMVDCDVFADGVHEVPIIVVTSPAVGASVTPGADLTLQGIAVDCHVEIGAGINRVSAYLGPREAGGLPLGEATLRLPNPITVLPADQYQGVSGWTLRTKPPLKPGEMNDVYVYARSEMTQRETSVRLPLMAAGTSDTRPAAATPTPTAAPAAEPPAPNAPAEVTIPAPGPAAVPLASNAPEEATTPGTGEPALLPTDGDPPAPIDQAAGD